MRGMTASGRPTNRLARESSPYLRLHAHNPVEWYPWGVEAIDRARAEDKPIFLSVGYSTCYWCHVMERESFSDPGIAEAMNRNFVNIKVDREERPDLDEVYMLATQILSGQGGWPNSVFLTPRLEPYFAGTYFPPRDAHGRPGFPTVLESMVHAWRDRRDEVEEQAAELGAAIRRHLDEIEPWDQELPGAELAVKSLEGLRQRFDPTWGGFGQQPKFPTPANLWLLAEVAESAGELAATPEERDAAAMMLTATLDAMARGGICDQLGGGFHRYATDREWRLPHFEKMLYDNGLLLELYAREHGRTGHPEARRVALAAAGWLGREMTSPEGAFWSAVDAETDGHEGAYYVWTRDELVGALGPEEATFLAPLFGFAEEPFFEENAYVIHLPRPLDVQARARRTTREELLLEIEPLRARLLAARDRRRRPATDDKILADWNGTAISGLAVAGRLLGDAELTRRAERAAEFVLAHLRGPDGKLLHTWRSGEGRIAGFLSDYVFFVRGLLRLFEATGAPRWLEEARRLQQEQGRRLGSPRGGYFNAEGAADLLYRSKELFDGAMPAANGVAALNLIDLAAASGEEAYLDEAERTLRAFAPIVSTHPDGARTMSLALARFSRRDAAAARRSAAANAGAGAASSGRVAVEDSRIELGVAASDGFRGFTLSFRVREGWHLPVEEGHPRIVGEGATLGRVEWPTARPIQGGLAGFEGRVEVRGRVRAEAPRACILLRFVACGEGSCRPPEEIEIALV
jgi:hypothetical protein